MDDNVPWVCTLQLYLNLKQIGGWTNSCKKMSSGGEGTERGDTCMQAHHRRMDAVDDRTSEKRERGKKGEAWIKGTKQCKGPVH